MSKFHFFTHSKTHIFGQKTIIFLNCLTDRSCPKAVLTNRLTDKCIQTNKQIIKNNKFEMEWKTFIWFFFYFQLLLPCIFFHLWIFIHVLCWILLLHTTQSKVFFRKATIFFRKGHKIIYDRIKDIYFDTKFF